MPLSVTCKLLLYADDSALIISVTDPEKFADKLSEELESGQKWLRDNKLSLYLGSNHFRHKEQTHKCQICYSPK